MARYRSIWEVRRLPDSHDPQLQSAAGGDVARGAGNGFAHLARFVALMRDSSLAASIEFFYDPAPPSANPQDRLRIHLQVESDDQGLHESAAALVQNGAIWRLYQPKALEGGAEPQRNLGTTLMLTRRLEVIAPTISRDLNAKIPERLWSVTSFVSNDGNDYGELLAVLNGIHEKVRITLRVAPCDIEPGRLAHSRHLAALQSVNRHWESDEPADFSWDIDGAREPYGRQVSVLQPLRIREPLADELAKVQQRFHESLRQRHVRFQVLVSSESPSVAALIASAVAECSLQEGQYNIGPLLHDDGDFTMFDEPMADRHREPSGSKAAEGDLEARDREALDGLAHKAPVEEIVGLFRLPVASHASPCCIRKNTDPEPLDETEAVIFGRDDELSGGHVSGMPVGMPLQLLAKHLAIFGLPGSGKTTTVMNLMIQLSRFALNDREATP